MLASGPSSLTESHLKFEFEGVIKSDIISSLIWGKVFFLYKKKKKKMRHDIC